MGNYAWQCNYCEKPYHLGPCDQPAGVSAAVRACVSDLKRELSETDASHRLRAGTVRYYINKLEAALHPEQAKDGAAG